MERAVAREPPSERSEERLILVLGKNIIDVGSVEVVASYVAFEFKVIILHAVLN